MAYAGKVFEKQGKRLFIEESSQLNSLPKVNVFRDFANMPRVAAVVPAKGTSSRVPSKNTKLLGNKPLYLHIIDTLLSCATIDEIYLDTESEEVSELLGNRPVNWIKRDPKLASNATDGNSLLLYEASQITNADIIVQALPTGPFLSRKSIDETVYSLIIDRTLESAFTVLKSKNYTWNHNGTPNYDIDKIPNSVDLQPTIIEAMNLYAIRKEALLSLKRRIGNKFHMQEISEIEATDIDIPEDFMIAEAIYQKINEGQQYEKR
jgi:CMP-N-acetylneuraminic acid synthetase